MPTVHGQRTWLIDKTLAGAERHNCREKIDEINRPT